MTQLISETFDDFMPLVSERFEINHGQIQYIDRLFAQGRY